MGIGSVHADRVSVHRSSQPTSSPREVFLLPLIPRSWLAAGKLWGWAWAVTPLCGPRSHWLMQRQVGFRTLSGGGRVEVMFKVTTQ